MCYRLARSMLTAYHSNCRKCKVKICAIKEMVISTTGDFCSHTGYPGMVQSLQFEGRIYALISTVELIYSLQTGLKVYRKQLALHLLFDGEPSSVRDFLDLT